MFNLYLNSLDISKVQMHNDIWFDRYHEDYKFDERHAGVIRRVDKSELDTQRMRIIPRYDKGIYIKLTELSTGCKTVLNIMENNSRCFYLGECGKNAFGEILRLNNGNGYLNALSIPPVFENDIRVHFNSRSKVCHNDVELIEIMTSVFKGV